MFHNLVGEKNVQFGALLWPVGWLLKTDPWVISQQELAACLPWTYFWEQDYDILYPKLQNDKITCV